MNEEEKTQKETEKKDKQKKKNKTDRGIESLFRITFKNHLNLNKKYQIEDFILT